jgi:hypothetical protein
MKAAKAACLSRKITNHSVRKTCISRLMDADVPTNFVAQLSGHKNLKSLDAYKMASVTHQRQMSRILSCSASDRPTSSASSLLQTLEVRSVSHSQTSNSAWLNSTLTVSKTTGLGSMVAHLTSTLVLMIARMSRSRPKKDVFPSLMIVIRSMLFNNRNLKKTQFLYMNYSISC